MKRVRLKRGQCVEIAGCRVEISSITPRRLGEPTVELVVHGAAETPADPPLMEKISVDSIRRRFGGTRRSANDPRNQPAFG